MRTGKWIAGSGRGLIDGSFGWWIDGYRCAQPILRLLHISLNRTPGRVDQGRRPHPPQCLNFVRIVIGGYATLYPFACLDIFVVTACWIASQYCLFFVTIHPFPVNKK